MQTTGMREGDIVKLDVRGQTFFALIAEPPHTDSLTKRRMVGLAPLKPGQSLLTYKVTSQQITDHWRKRRRRGAANDGKHGNGDD